MTEQDDSGDPHTDETPLENIRDLRGHYMEKKQEAIREGDEIGAAYFSGQVSGLIHAEEVLKDE